MKMTKKFQHYLKKNVTYTKPIGVYPQSDGSLAMIDIDASKGIIALWVHFFVAIDGIHRNGYRQKRVFAQDKTPTPNCYIGFLLLPVGSLGCNLVHV